MIKKFPKKSQPIFNVRLPDWLKPLWLSGLGIAVVCLLFIDIPLAEAARAQPDAIKELWAWLTLLGNSTPYFLMTLVVLIIAWWQQRQTLNPRLRQQWWRRHIAALYVLMSLALSGLAVQLLKFIIGRERPSAYFNDGVVGFFPLGLRPEVLDVASSMPSGHAATAAALAFSLYALWGGQRWVYVLVAGLIACSRLALHKHFASDVIIGVLIGLTIAALLKDKVLAKMR